MRSRVALSTAVPIAAALVAAVAFDFAVVPPGARTAFESSPALLALMALNILAITLSFRLPRPEHIAYTAALVSVLLFALPGFLLVSGDPAAAGADAMLLRRTWLVIVVWVLALLGMERKRSLLEAESAKSDLERQVAERTELYERSTAAAQLIGTRLRQAQAIARLGNWQRDLVTNEVWWSDETFHLLGMTPGEVEPSFEAFLERLHPDDRPRHRQLVERAANLDKPRSADLRVILPNGAVRHVHTHAEVAVDDDGRPVRIIGTIQDVTERRKLEIEVAELMQRLDALASAAFDGIVVLEGGIVREVSDAFAAKLGRAVEDIVGKPLADFIAPAFRGSITEIPPANGLGSSELVFSKRNRDTVCMEGFSTTITTDDRERTIAGFRDIGRRVELEREIVEAAERERKRIGYELREHLGQLLVSIQWSIQSLASRLRARVADASEADGSHTDGSQADRREGDAIEAERLVEQIERITAEAHKLSATISPQIPDTLEVYPALKMLAVDVQRHTGANCELRCDTAERVPNREIASHLYRIAEEAVRIAVQTAHARNIELAFGCRDDLCTLTVVDDGKPAADADADAEGADRVWRNLRYRARLINGVVEIRKRATGGRQVLCAFPAA